MRNGNPVPDDPVINIHSSSYRTYEEWKLIFFRGVLVEFIQVLTVPMRNGNFDYVSYVDDCPVKFLPYLWGMETPLHLHRNNLLATFLPYLWGMETWFLETWLCVCESSYRTYEEWKPRISTWNSNAKHIRSYRTYEEWKLVPINRETLPSTTFLPYLWGMETHGTGGGRLIGTKGSYRTYEEWKRDYIL